MFCSTAYHFEINSEEVIDMLSVKEREKSDLENLSKFKKRIGDSYQRIPMNDLVMKIVEGIHKLKKADVDEYSNEVKYEFTSEERIRADIADTYFSTIEELKNAVGASQIQLFIYLLGTWSECSGAEEFHVEARDYFSKRGIAVRKGSKDRLERDLEILSALSIQLQAKQRKQTEYIDSYLIQYQKERSGFYKIRFGSWISHVSYRIFTLLHKSFFKLHPSHDSMAILLSIKLTQLAKLQFHKPLSSYSLKFHTLFSLLDISYEQIRKQGYKYYFNQLENIFRRLNEEMGFILKMDKEKGSFNSFMQNKLYYEQLELKQFYQR